MVSFQLKLLIRLIDQKSFSDFIAFGPIENDITVHGPAEHVHRNPFIHNLEHMDRKNILKEFFIYEIQYFVK